MTEVAGASGPRPSAARRSTARSSAPSEPGGVSSSVRLVAGADHRFGRGSVQVRRRRPAALLPALPQHDLGQRLAGRPAGTLQPGLGRPFVGPAQAEPAQRLHPVGQPDERGELVGLEQRHPPGADALDPGRQPQVLDGAGTRPHVGVDVGGAPQHALGGRPPVAADHDADGGLPDAVQLQVEHLAPGTVGERARLSVPFPVGHQRGPIAGVRVAHHHEAPRLGVAHRRGGMGGGEDALQHVGPEVVGAEAPDVAPTECHRVEHVPLRFVEGPGARRLPPRLGRRDVTDERDGPLPAHGRSTEASASARRSRPCTEGTATRVTPGSPKLEQSRTTTACGASASRRPP